MCHLAKKPNAAALFDIEKMAAASMKDIGSDEDVDDGLDPEDDDLLVSASFAAINHVWKSTVSSECHMACIGRMS